MSDDAAGKSVRLPVPFVDRTHVQDASPLGVLDFELVSVGAGGGAHTWATVRVNHESADTRPLIQSTPIP